MSRRWSTAAITSMALLTALILYKKRLGEEEESSHQHHWVEEEAAAEDSLVEEEVVDPSIFRFFQDLQVEYGISVENANAKRTVKYYELTRDAHQFNLVPGIRSYIRLRNRREHELSHSIFKYANAQPPKSHRTVVVMCDPFTSRILNQARKEILEPLSYSTDIATNGVWIPAENLIPESDMHVTVAIPWWWHTIRPGNLALSEEFVARIRQAVVMGYHHSFQIELERIVLLGGKSLVALWRCIGDRIAEDSNEIIYDRHGDQPDPFVRFRRDIVSCFTGREEYEELSNEPLTYSHRIHRLEQALPEIAPPIMAQGEPIERNNTVELKTPGLGGKDGFIHTTLARLPLECLSSSDVELDPIHRLCREATATYCGHRMVVSKYRFLETIGAGGTSNPCVDPLFDATIDTATRIEPTDNGSIGRNIGASAIQDVGTSVLLDGELFKLPSAS